MREMREWRKLYSSIVDSEQIAALSDSAFSLFTLLIIAQDDIGYYPWTPVKIRTLTISRGWTLEQAQSFFCEIKEAGLAIEQDGGIILVNGATLNGQPRNDRRTLTYQRLTTDIPVVDQLQRKKEPKKEIRHVREEERRVRAPAREDIPVVDQRLTTDIPVVDQRLTTGMSETTAAAAGGADSQDNIFSLYEANIGALTPMISEKLKDAGEHYPRDWIVDAFHEAVEHEARNWAYIEAILERRQAEERGDGVRVGTGRKTKAVARKSDEIDYVAAWKQ